ncbi:putative reverse transcriptase domain-containing protein [Tanacetum coccineum]
MQETTDKVVSIKEKFKAVRDRQKSYAGNRRKPLEFEVGDHVLLKVSPWKCLIYLEKKGKLAPRYVEPFEILEMIGLVAYRLRLPEELGSVHDTLHVSNLKKCLADANFHVPLDEIKIDKTLRFVEEPVEIMDHEIRNLKRSKISLMKVWKPKTKVLDHVSKHNMQYKLLEKSLIMVDCTRQIQVMMLGPKEAIFLSNKKIDGGYVAFGGNPKGGKITGRGGLTCLFAKATSDESELWHRRLGYINFKTINKLVKGNLVRGSPLKHFEMHQTCVACQKGKQHRASCTKACDDAGKVRIETIHGKDYIMLPLWTVDPPFSQSLKSSPDAGFKPLGDDEKKKDNNVNNINNVNAASTNKVNAVGGKTSIELPDNLNMPELEDYSIFKDDEDVVKQKEDGIISQEKYVTEILKKFGFTDVKTASKPMKTQKLFLKDKNGEEVDVHLYRLMIGYINVSYIFKTYIMFDRGAVQRIPTYTDSDYAGASLDRKSTTGGCQFLRSRLISWQCKKQTVVANSITEAEYVAVQVIVEQMPLDSESIT